MLLFLEILKHWIIIIMENLSQFVESCDKLAHIVQDVFSKIRWKSFGNLQKVSKQRYGSVFKWFLWFFFVKLSNSLLVMDGQCCNKALKTIIYLTNQRILIFLPYLMALHSGDTELCDVDKCSELSMCQIGEA